MHRLGLGLVVGLILAAGAPAYGQDGRGATYWPRKRIDFPVPVKIINEMNPRPEKLRLYAAEAGGRFVMVAEKTPETLDQFEDLRGNKLRGFTYTARDDGEVTFATQRVYRDGKESPRTEDLAAESRVVFDTRPPSVQIAAVGTLGVEWDVRDENLDPDGVSLQARYKDTKSDWKAWKDRLNAQDKYTISKIQAGYKLEVRIVAKDRAGNEMASRPIVLPADGVGGGLNRNDNGIAPTRGGDPLLNNGGNGTGHLLRRRTAEPPGRRIRQPLRLHRQIQAHSSHHVRRESRSPLDESARSAGHAAGLEDRSRPTS